MHYWSSILGILRKTVGAEVIVTSVPGTGSIASRAEQLDRFLQIKAFGRGINFMAHSMGGLDCRHLITHLKPADYTPLSLTTIATPHRGSPFMDWCQARRLHTSSRHYAKLLLFVAIRSTLVWVGGGLKRKNGHSQPQRVPSRPSLCSQLPKQRHHILQMRDCHPRSHSPLYHRRSRHFYSACSTRQPMPT